MDLEKNIFSQLEKNTKPSVPKGFFKSFPDLVISKVEQTNLFRIENLEKNSKPEVNADFFNQPFNENLLQERDIHSKSTRLRFLLWGGAIAAIFTLIFTFSNIDNTNLDYSSTELTESDEILLAYFSEGDLINYMSSENELAVNEESLYDELESDIFNYLNY